MVLFIYLYNPGQWFKDNFKEIVRAEKEREKRQEYNQIYEAWNDNVIIPVKNYIANSFAKKNNNSTLELWEIGDREAENIHRFISLNLKGFRHLLLDSDIRHIRNTHGANAKKIRADEVRLTDEDFYRIPDILANPDNVTVGNRSSNGDATLRFEKNKNDGTVTIVETIMSDKTLRVKTMWKDKYEGHSANIVNPPNTSKNAHNNLSTIEAIIKQKGIDVKQNNNAYNQQDLGATSWDAAGRATITLMQKADASTLIHESGHVFLAALWNDIQRGIATEQELKEFETLMNYAGITTEQYAAMDFEGRRKTHEIIAEAMESYVMKGKSPNKELRTFFKRFMKLLNNIYNIAKGGRNRSANYIPCSA